MRRAVSLGAKGADISVPHIVTEDDDDIEQLGERICEYDWPEAELTKAEIEMFETAGITASIKRKPAKKSKK